MGVSSQVSPRFWALVRQSRQAGGCTRDTEGPGTRRQRMGSPEEVLCSRIRIVNFVLNCRTAAGGKDGGWGGSGLCSDSPGRGVDVGRAGQAPLPPLPSPLRLNTPCDCQTR